MLYMMINGIIEVTRVILNNKNLKLLLLCKNKSFLKVGLKMHCFAF